MSTDEFSPRLGPKADENTANHQIIQSEVVSSKNVPKIHIDPNVRSPTDDQNSNKFSFRNPLNKNQSPHELRHNTFGDASESDKRAALLNSDQIGIPEYSFQEKVSSRQDLGPHKIQLTSESKGLQNKKEDDLGDPLYHISKISDLTQAQTNDENSLPKKFKRIMAQVQRGTGPNIQLEPGELKKSSQSQPQTGKNYRRLNLTETILDQVDETRKISVPESNSFVFNNEPSYDVMHTSEFGPNDTESDQKMSPAHPPTRESHFGIFNLTKTPYDIFGEYKKLLVKTNIHVIDHVINREQERYLQQQRSQRKRSFDSEVHKRLKALQQIVNFSKMHQNQFRLGHIAPPGSRLDQDLNQTNKRINVGKMLPPENITMSKAILIQQNRNVREKSREQQSINTKHRVSFQLPNTLTQAEENLRKNFRFRSSIIKPDINPVRIPPTRDKRTLHMSPFIYKVYQLPREASLEKYQMEDPANEMGSLYHNVRSLNARKKSSNMMIVTPDRSFENGIIYEEKEQREDTQMSHSQLI